TLGLPPGEPGGGMTGVEVGPGSGGVIWILGSILPPGLMTPRDLSSFSLGFSPGGVCAVCAVCAADGAAPYTSDNSTPIATRRNMAVARMRNTNMTSSGAL